MVGGEREKVWMEVFHNPLDHQCAILSIFVHVISQDDGDYFAAPISFLSDMRWVVLGYMVIVDIYIYIYIYIFSEKIFPTMQIKSIQKYKSTSVVLNIGNIFLPLWIILGFVIFGHSYIRYPMKCLKI